jgi:hypothetical protein
VLSVSTADQEDQERVIKVCNVGVGEFHIVDGPVRYRASSEDREQSKKMTPADSAVIVASRHEWKEDGKGRLR